MADKRGGCLDYEFARESDERVLRFDCEECPFFPSLEDNEAVMSAVVDALIENPSTTRVVLSQKRDYEYDYEQTSMLAEVAKIQSQLARQRFLFVGREPSVFVQLKNILYHR